MITCYFENDAKASLRHVVADVVVINDDKILLVKRSEKIPAGGKWGLPGGYLERDETVIAGATREVFEETGWTIKDITFMDISDSSVITPDDDRQNIGFCFYAQADEQTGQPDWESDELKWFGFDELPPAEQIAFNHLTTINKYLELNAKQVAKLPLFRD